MDRWNNCVAVVTGASSGIGEAIAKDLVIAGLQVVAIDRRHERLEKNRLNVPVQLQKNFHTRLCDVTNEDAVKATFAWIEETLGGTDILINNAGIVRQGNLVEMDTALLDEVLNTNVKGIVYCTQQAFKSMKNRKVDGHIVLINSTSGHRVMEPFPGVSLNIYPPSKFAVTAINETLRNEMRNLGTKIKTTSISPGAVRTEIAPAEQWDNFGSKVLEAQDISQTVLFALSTPPHVQIHEIIVKPVEEEQ